jgi:Suppressor of fused protein (SUFU)
LQPLPERRPQAEAVLKHFERDLGEFAGAGVMKPETDLDFSLLQFDDRPEDGVTATVTFGLSIHVLNGRDAVQRREELILLLQRDFDGQALDAAANIGRYLLDEHVALVEGETVGMPGQADSTLDRLVVAAPEPFAPRFARYDDADLAVEIVWLLPFAPSEHHIVAEHGWRDLLQHIRAIGASPYDLLRPVVL